MVIKPEDRQLLAAFVNNITKEQRREILDRLVRSILNNREEMEKFPEQLDGDPAKNGQGHINNAA